MAAAYRRLAWSAALTCYALIVLGGVVRITGSGLGCGNHWPLCNARLLPPLDLPTIIEYGHRLVAGAVSFLVLALGWVTWLARRGADRRLQSAPSRAPYLAVALLILQVTLGAITVKLDLPPWTVILHLGTAMLLFATLLFAARQSLTPGTPGAPGLRPGLGTAVTALIFATVLLGALTANLGAASACLGFPLCNGQVIPEGNRFQYIQWAHRLLAYSLGVAAVIWAVRSRTRGPRWVLALVLAQVGVAAAMVLEGLPEGLRVLHVAVGAAVWGGAVLAALSDVSRAP
jgi:heme A synthase